MKNHFFHFCRKKKDSIPNHFIKEIVSGGQTGVDRAALDIAIELGIPHSGWCPYGRKAEDGIIPTKYNLKETSAPTPEESTDSDAIYKKRTELNAKDSDGTLVVVKNTPIGGTLYTIQMAQKHKKPFLILDLSKNLNIRVITCWIIENKIHKLNIAGPRASQDPNIYYSTVAVLRNILNYELPNQNAPDTKQSFNAKL